jgi:hypothetical protein
VLNHEPGLLLPFLGFKRVDVLYAHTSAVLGPHLQRFVATERAAWLCEWAARTFLSYLFNPDAEVDLADAGHARRLVAGYVMAPFAPIAPTAPDPAISTASHETSTRSRS